jgi:uncharacterized protein (DUF427 family)
MKASWNGKIIAESNETIVVEGNHYFPRVSINNEFFKSSQLLTSCPWKGEASYYSIEVDGSRNEDAAWYYPSPKEAAAEIKEHIAFWKGVAINE